MKKEYSLFNLLASGAAGLLTAYAITTKKHQPELSTAQEWTVTILLLGLGAGFLFFTFLPGAWAQFREIKQTTRYWAVSLAVLSTAVFASASGIIELIPFLLLGFALLSPGFSSLESIAEQKRVSRFILAWALGGFTSFFATGFFKNFYPSLWEFIFYTIGLNIIFTIFFDAILEDRIPSAGNITFEKVVTVSVLLLGGVFVILSVRMLAQAPAIFKADFFLPAPHLIPLFIGLTILSQSWSALADRKLQKYHWRSSSFILWIKRNFPGLILASALTAFAYLFAIVLVSTDLGLVDNYFDTDSPLWLKLLLTGPEVNDTVRAVHPYILMILKPLIWLFSLLTHGDIFHATLLLNASAGGLCVFLTWYFFKKRTGRTSYALLMGALLGFTTAHLLLSVFVETYIFSAAALIASVLILSKKDVKLEHSVAAGLVTFGITITNLIQTGILFLFTQKSIKKTIQYGVITVAVAVVLNFVQNTIEPYNQVFYVTSNLSRESAYQRTILDVPISETASRANAIGRTLVLSSVIAPRPMILLEEAGCSYPCFKTLRFINGKYHYASYIGFGSWLARTWFALLLISGILFLRQLFRSPSDASLQAALALNLLFNFILHMNYGDDPLLYTPNWTYALIFFFGISYEAFADKKWIQIILLVFLTALLFNNIELFHKILDAILPFRT